MGGKVERDIWGSIAVLADAFGGSDNPALQEAAAQARKYAGGIPDPPAKADATNGKEVALVYCEACQVHHVDGQHSTKETSPPPPAKTGTGPDLYCVYDKNCNFLRPYRSAVAAVQAAQLVDGYVRTVKASDLPEEGARDGAM